jgi:hypothetical protein
MLALPFMRILCGFSKEAFNFSVTWDGARDTIVIDTSKNYAAE